MLKILSIGDLNIDIVIPFEMPSHGKQVFVKDCHFSGGGCAANFAVACARLGAKSKLVSRIGADIFSKYLLTELRRHGVDEKDIVVSTRDKTGVSLAMVRGGDRSIITHRGANATLSLADLKGFKMDAELVHLPSFFILERLRPSYVKIEKWARKAGALISFDTGWDPSGRWSRTKHLLKALRGCDFFLPNLHEARSILNKPRGNPKELAEELLLMGIKTVAIKLGHRGAFVADGSTSAYIPPLRVKVIDPTGAGDVFNAAFLLSYIKTRDLIKSGRFASAAAAIKIAGAGWSSYPTAAQVHRFLRKHPPENT
ncbi:MAG: carbohydrate kinase family protein [Hadesarchaea archaeon]|nr:carbohydrate kinase family protein [Hadesarchaea archaeon]